MKILIKEVVISKPVKSRKSFLNSTLMNHSHSLYAVTTAAAAAAASATASTAAFATAVHAHEWAMSNLSIVGTG